MLHYVMDYSMKKFVGTRYFKGGRYCYEPPIASKHAFKVTLLSDFASQVLAIDAADFQNKKKTVRQKLEKG